ncbi:carbohydrate ABC transporter permease [Sphaerisporangium rubeum]|uniref:Multiple sugar transport system permease protein n=1 Tax=Sphaerisporangium rubeum TaxID=321317 RepID=A0A7X0II92_9ACTN|nr:carbohydrate ABC transporter permease [Sphaerisporangium rubeum]MBB6475721.1 multiple sugar transport system permease protein [Sphaerisporangium rubeum]
MTTTSAPAGDRFQLARLRVAGRYLFITVVCLVVLFPIYWMVLTAIQSPASTLHYPPSLWPTELDLSGFAKVFQDLPIGGWLVNSTLLSLAATVVTTLLATIGAYALSALRWPGRALFGVLLMTTQMMPEAIVIIPIYQLYSRADMVNSLLALSLLHAAFVLPIGVWILRSAMSGVPREIREAALIDGCSHIGVLRRIMVPLTSPAIVAVAVVAFFASWGEYLFATTMITSPERYPAAVGLATLIGQLDTQVDVLLAGGLIYALPPVVLYMLIQRFIISGLTAGGVKG